MDRSPFSSAFTSRTAQVRRALAGVGWAWLLLSVVLYAPGLLVFIYARRTHQLDNALKRREMALIGLLLVAAVPATWMLMG